MKRQCSISPVVQAVRRIGGAAVIFCVWATVAMGADPASSSPAPAAPASGSSPAKPGSAMSVFARVQAIEASKNTFSASNTASVFLVRCSASTLARVGGPVVKAEDLKVGSEVVIRGRLEADGSVSASFIGSRAPGSSPSMKPAAPKEGKAPAAK